MKKKGFTLVELLAVIIIVAIIALIVAPIIMNIIKEARKKAAIESFRGYMDAVEKTIIRDSMKTTSELPSSDSNGCYLMNELNTHIKIKGDMPEADDADDNICIKNGKVFSVSEITLKGYKLEYKDGDILVNGKSTEGNVSTISITNEETEIKVGNTLQLSVSVTPSDANKTFTYTSSDTTKATVSNSGLVTGVATGTVTITVKAKNGKKATIILTIKKENIADSFKSKMTLLSSTSSSENPVYYYNGTSGATNNNVVLGNYCWKIIRTTSTGGMKMIYNGTVADGKCTTTTGVSTQIGTSIYNSTYNSTAYNSTAKTQVDNWYNNNLKATYDSWLETTQFCGDTLNTSNPLSCSTSYYLKVGLISAGEEYLAGLNTSNSNTSNYLYTGQQYWTMSAGSGSSKTVISPSGIIVYQLTADRSCDEGTSSNMLTTTSNGQIANNSNGTYYGVCRLTACYYMDVSTNYSEPISCCTASNNTQVSGCSPWGQNVTGGGFTNPEYVVKTGSSLGLRPVISVSSTVKKAGGDGSVNNPYTLKLNN